MSEDLFSGVTPGASSSDTTFDEVMRGLSDAQRRAVVHDGGPLIVLAGPGTGKTRVITARVAYMIHERGIDPDRIAAVTFTNKAAGELRERLTGLVGSTRAARVHASTFHSLGFGILRRFADLLGLPSVPTIMDSAQRVRLIRSIIRDEGLYRDSLSTGIDAAADHAHEVMEALRHRGMDASSASSWFRGAMEGLDALPAEDRDARRGELERFAEAVRVYEHFERRSRERGWVVIDDLIMLPTKLLRTNEAVASIVRRECTHLVVDEFQDVNRAQIEFIRALCPPGERADVCVVGDDDQSIYGFRGSDDRAFARFASIWSGASRVELTTNYRSAQVIVDAGNASISRAVSRFAPDKRADAHRGEVEGSSLELVRMDDDARTGEVIASMLLRMASEGGEDFSFSSCAVIARKRKFLDQVARTLMLEGIPVDMRERAAPLEDEGVLDVLAWSRLLVNPGSSEDLRRVLTRMPYRVDPRFLSQQIGLYQAARSRFERFGADPDATERDPGTLIDWLIERSEGTTRDRIEAMNAQMMDLGYIAAERPAAEVLMEIIKRTGVVHRDLSDGRTRSRRIASLATLLRFARTRSDRFDAPGDLAAMLSYLDDLQGQERTLSEMPEDRVMNPEPEEADDDRGAVAMLTAHTSKGLEFDTVFIVRVGNHGFAPTKADESVLPEGLDGDDDDRDAASRGGDEERRVFFVALTRAMRRAIITAKLPKTTSVDNYALELRESMGERLIERDADDVVDASVAGDAVSRLSANFKAMSRLRDAFDEAEREARHDVAEALDAHELGEIDHAELAMRVDRARDRVAVVHEVRRTGRLPDWVRDDSTRGFAARLLEVLQQQRVPSASSLAPGLSAPLRLSYSRINAYLRCPRCYLAEYVYNLGFDERSVSLVMGDAVHQGLEQFYREWSGADTEGRERPGYARLLELVRMRFRHLWEPSRQIEADRLEQLDALVDVYWNRLHSDGAHILELERSIEMPYECDGVTHTLNAKIDRIDALGSGWRVIDYKTGKPKQALKTPKKTDLQLGIYAMALTHELGEPGEGSVCEYWCLQDGSRGVIGFDALDLGRIRKQIDKAIRGMLQGDWSRGRICTSDDASCTIFDSPGFDADGAFSDGVSGGGV